MQGLCCCGERKEDEGEEQIQNTDGDKHLVNRNHTWGQAVFISAGLSMCITVDILQYSMPLAFLPSVLEDRGHSTFKIASAIGVYYWTGFAGGFCITSYQILRLLCACGERQTDLTTLSMARAHLRYLIYGLGVGTVTLACQAMHPHFQVHLICRFLQGFAGAFIFFYAFLLSVNCFNADSPQQDFAMTSASAALNVAEVLGSLFGALLFDSWGQRSVFWFLTVASLLNQIYLVAIIYMLEESDIPVEEMSVNLSRGPSMEDIRRIKRSGFKRLWDVLQSKRLACAVTLIFTAAIVKGSVEEMLPFHADHQWGFEPLAIGQLFAIIAFSYIAAAVISGRIWRSLQSWRIAFSAFWLAMLGVVALGVFSLSGQGASKEAFWGALLCYGMCLGLTHTPAALLLADAVENEQGVAKDAVNGIWNTMWEAGGSMGFLLGGLLAEHYSGELLLLTGCSVVCFIGAIVMVAVNKSSGDTTPRRPSLEKVPIAAPEQATSPSKAGKMNGENNYGSAA